MEKPDDWWGNLASWASGAAALVYAAWVFISKLIKRSKEDTMFTSLEIGGTAPEIRFAARLAALEQKQDEREAKDDERHQQNTGNIDRILDELGEQRKMLMSVVRKLAGMS